MRYRNTDRAGSNFMPSKVNTIWEKARIIQGYNANDFRKDSCGALIKKGAHGDRDSKYGWEIDHIVPVARNGSDNDSNLQPLHWKNNSEKADKPDRQWVCKITA